MMFAKRRRIEIPKLLRAAKDEECQFQGPTCQGGTDTTVAMHSNMGEDGKGMGQKADDIYICFGCNACHCFLDGGYSNKGYSQWQVEEMFHRGMKRTWRRLIEKGVLR